MIGQTGPRGEGFPSAKLGTAVAVSNSTAASTSKSFFMVLLLFWEMASVVLCTMRRAVGREGLVQQVFGKSKFSWNGEPHYKTYR